MMDISGLVTREAGEVPNCNVDNVFDVDIVGIQSEYIQSTYSILK